MPLCGLHTSYNQIGASMIFYCKECHDMKQTVIDDQSFGHEFGTEHIYDYNCVDCGKTLHVGRTKPRVCYRDED